MVRRFLVASLGLTVLAVAAIQLPQHAGGAAAPRQTTPSIQVLDDMRHASDRLSFQRAMTTPPALVYSNPLLRREVFGFAPYWELQHYSEWNLNLVNTIGYFGLDVNDDGTFATVGSGWDGWTSSNLANLITQAHAAGDRVVLVIKDHQDASINKIVTTAALQTLVDGTMAAMSSKGLDGVNVDFEPSGSPLFPDIPLGMTNLMKAMSSQVHTRYPNAEVTIDTYAGSASWDGGSFVIGNLAPYTDAFVVMAYDSVFSNMPGQAGPNSPLNGWTYNDTVDVSQYLTKAPASKVILAVPYYGYVWSTVDGTPYSSTVSGGQAITYTGAVGNLTCGAIAQTVGWDATGQSPWTAWWSPSSNDPCGDNAGRPREMYFDNATSLGIKYDLINSQNLRGVGIWALGYDTGRTELWNELATKFTGATPWDSLGGTLASGIGAASWGPNRTDVFTRDAGNALQQVTWNGTVASSWIPLGGVLMSDPGVVSWGANRIDVFAKGQDGGLWHMWWSGTAWSPWYPLGGGLAGSAGASAWSPGRLDVFVRGKDNGLWHIAWNGTSWNGWQSLGGVLASDPTAVSWGPNRIDVFAKGQNNALWHIWWNGTSWGTWESLGGTLTSGPAASSCGNGHLDVFALGTGSVLQQLGYNGSRWSAWTSLGQQQWASNPAAACASAWYAQDVFERGSDNALWHIEVPAS